MCDYNVDIRWKRRLLPRLGGESWQPPPPRQRGHQNMGWNARETYFTVLSRLEDKGAGGTGYSQRDIVTMTWWKRYCGHRWMDVHDYPFATNVIRLLSWLRRQWRAGVRDNLAILGRQAVVVSSAVNHSHVGREVELHGWSEAPRIII